MNNLATVQTEVSTPVPSAQESIAACKAHFNGQSTRRTLKEMWGKMPPRFRGMILIAGDLKASEHVREFDSFTDLELTKIRRGMQTIKEMSVLFDSKLGDVRRLRHYQFSSTH